MFITSASATPLISFEELDFDFGEVKQGDVVEHIFIFENKGTSDLIIEKVGST